MTDKFDLSNNISFHKGFYEYDKDNIKEQLAKIKSINPIMILKNGEYIYYEANIFLHGICHIFAYVLHQKFGYEILEIKSKSSSMVHWCCVSNYNGKCLYIDVRGATTNYEEFIWEFQPEMGNNPLKTKIKNLYDYNDEWEEESQIKFANEIITKYYNYYSLN